MRYMIKGGVWKNSEDEILKAAVMKYGLNQWSRISSLLVRKSAKQCKARWYEWLDPSIKKTEWTKEEEEKLLHLAKIFPCQWRTIAPIVGRTPAQCVEHYEKLLDQAQGKEIDENDPRKLKPGEIDPTPETKPAKPDPKDMDEDEKEMLAEARVRLANTKGKKAKRKAREKQIEEARRLAQIQKKRELKAAGIEYMIKKKVKGIDYNTEIPFERKPLDIAFSTGVEEEPKPNLHLGNISLQTLEGSRRDEEEEKMRKVDQKRIKKLKERNLPEALEKNTKINEAMFNNKIKLNLPAPQIHDKELESLGKINTQTIEEDGQNTATKYLVGNYSQREPTPLAMRTPRIENSVMREAQNVIALMNTQTPLLGGENTPLNNPDFSGLTPRPQPIQTPNILSTNFATPKPRSNLPTQTPRNPFEAPPSVIRQTPLRDGLKINKEEMDHNWEIMSQSGTSIHDGRSENMKIQTIKQQIKNNLFQLPKPKNEYQIELPEIQDFSIPEEQKKVLDAEDEKKIRLEEQRKELEKLEKLTPLVIRKNLPRPFKPNPSIIDAYISRVKDNANLKEAAKLIGEEVIFMLNRDALNYPSKGVNYLERVIDDTNFEVDELENAKKIIEVETKNLRDKARDENVDLNEFDIMWEEYDEKIIYNHSKNIYVDINSVSQEDRIYTLQNDFSMRKDKLAKEAKKLETLEKKANLLFAGYNKVIDQNAKANSALLIKLEDFNRDFEVFKTLKQQEQKAMHHRLDELNRFYNSLMEKEALLQKKYEGLRDEKIELLVDIGY